MRGLGRGIGIGSGGFWEEGSRWWCDGVGPGGGVRFWVGTDTAVVEGLSLEQAGVCVRKSARNSKMQLCPAGSVS